MKAAWLTRAAALSVALEATGKELKGRGSLGGAGGSALGFSRSNWERIERTATRTPSRPPLHERSNWERIESTVTAFYNAQAQPLASGTVSRSNWERIERVSVSYRSTAAQRLREATGKELKAARLARRAHALMPLEATGKELKAQQRPLELRPPQGISVEATGKELKVITYLLRQGVNPSMKQLGKN